ncbi:hypothetical protein [Shewanella frigidimarina]|uniref:hypothetical protein n=1 Tax=Shewanella frigidimarina TaxID=56812 RepID=UPI003D7B9B3A
MSQSKKDLIDCFLTQIRSIELPENATIDQLLEEDFKKFKLAEKVLLENPILLEADCSGRGLPAQRYTYYGHIHGFNMNDLLIVQLKKLDNLNDYFAQG